MNQLVRNLVWAFVSLEGAMLLLDAQSRGRLYGTFSQCILILDIVNEVSLPVIQNLSQNFRLALVLCLLPTFFYPRSWVIPKFFSLVGYVFYICINCNIMIFNEPQDIKFLVVHLLVLVEIMAFLVDDIVSQQKKSQNSIRSKGASASKQQTVREQPLPKSERRKFKTT